MICYHLYLIDFYNVSTLYFTTIGIQSYSVRISDRYNVYINELPIELRTNNLNVQKASQMIKFLQKGG